MSAPRWQPGGATGPQADGSDSGPVSSREDESADEDLTREGDAYFAAHGFRRTARPFDPEQTRRRLGDVVEQAGICAQITAEGQQRFYADDFDALKTRMAAARSIEIIAEATAKLHSTVKEQFPEVQWREIYRMRTLVAHHYDRVRDALVWSAISANIPAMVETLGLPDSPAETMTLPGGLGE